LCAFVFFAAKFFFSLLGAALPRYVLALVDQ
jgi:hypothetical protein